MTDGDALHAAILAHPDEDTPRLAYADWLDENDGHDRPARAEFIRVQTEVSRFAPNEVVPWNRPLVELGAREKVLLAAHGEEWLAPLKGEGGPLHGLAHGAFRRGFVEVVWMTAGRFLERASALFDLALVRELRVTETTPAQFVALAGSPSLARLNGLDLSDRRLGDAAATALGWSVAARNLRVLRLRGCGLTDHGVTWLVRPDLGWRLRELDVSNNPITPAGAAALRERFGGAVHAAGLTWTA